MKALASRILQGLIFDMDGVILDSHPAHVAAWRRLFHSLGMHICDSELQYVREGCKREDILRHFLGELSREQIREYGERKNEFFKQCVSQVGVIAGISELLNDLRACRVPLAVASSAGRGRAQSMLARLGLTSHFDVVISGDDVAQGKPDPEIFYRAARELNIESGDVLVCEDSVFGVMAAKRAGMKCLGIADGDRAATLMNAGADCVFPDFRLVRVADLEHLFAASTPVKQMHQHQSKEEGKLLFSSSPLSSVRGTRSH